MGLFLVEKWQKRRKLHFFCIFFVEKFGDIKILPTFALAISNGGFI